MKLFLKLSPVGNPHRLNIGCDVTRGPGHMLIHILVTNQNLDPTQQVILI